MRYLSVLVLAAITISTHAGFNDDKEIALGGVSFGMTDQALLAVAKKAHRSLEGPGEKLMAADVRVFVQDYVVSKDKQIKTVSGARRQTIMLLKVGNGPYKVIGVEFLFKSKSSCDSYLSRLKKLGYQEKGGEYVGKLLTGKHAGLTVAVKSEMIMGGRRGRTKYYTVLARCFEVLGKGITAEKIIKAQKNGGVRGERRGVGGAI